MLLSSVGHFFSSLLLSSFIIIIIVVVVFLPHVSALTALFILVYWLLLLLLLIQLIYLAERDWKCTQTIHKKEFQRQLARLRNEYTPWSNHQFAKKERENDLKIRTTITTWTEIQWVFSWIFDNLLGIQSRIVISPNRVWNQCLCLLVFRLSCILFFCFSLLNCLTDGLGQAIIVHALNLFFIHHWRKKKRSRAPYNYIEVEISSWYQTIYLHFAFQSLMQITLSTNTGKFNVVRRFFFHLLQVPPFALFSLSLFLAISISFSGFTAFYILMT